MDFIDDNLDGGAIYIGERGHVEGQPRYVDRLQLDERHLSTDDVVECRHIELDISDFALPREEACRHLLFPEADDKLGQLL
eukprot:CAMPEP_0113598438 /NCGR_PEP_ID=MMETSP0015_2-20120614/41589_1 /TAXON_ID=2838 /ORGANISM="Odontella" /LENGTH=80 /DNA_ID=CAMNT_0000506459 /DNA_START=177 /DNA_END=419 /DNA_ORIENTATION=- /assembly_acc=CAM_ASM_000160